jgi:hypothetical protein
VFTGHREYIKQRIGLDCDGKDYEWKIDEEENKQGDNGVPEMSRQVLPVFCPTDRDAGGLG